MSRGIMSHGGFKTFLTRGIFGVFFRPILYSKIDKINYDYNSVITATIKGIDGKINQVNKMSFQIWFSMAPLWYFELLFLPNEKAQVSIPMLEKAEINNGKECAYLTQGFMLYNLEQYIANSPEYREATKFTVKNIEEVCDIVFGKGNKTRKYLDYFRAKFDGTSIHVLDHPIFYVYEATKLFIPDKIRQRSAIEEWDEDLSGKFKFINEFADFLHMQKENSLKMIK